MSVATGGGSSGARAVSLTRPGCFITLEGIEGSGKSTLAQALATALERSGVAVTVTREPGGTPLAERLRAVLLARGEEPITPLAEMLLMFSARSIHIENQIRPALQSGRWVICDRFTDATRAYQGGGRGVAAALIEQLATMVHRELWPRRTLLLDLPVELGCARARGRDRPQDRFDQENQAFFERVRAAYLQIASAEPQRVRVLDATMSPERLVQQALQALVDLLPPVG